MLRFAFRYSQLLIMLVEIAVTVVGKVLSNRQSNRRSKTEAPPPEAAADAQRGRPDGDLF